MTFDEALKNGIRQAFCQAASNASNLYEFFKELLPLAPRFPNVADFWRQLLCNIPPDPPTPPFPGGQCSKKYDVTVRAITRGTDGTILDNRTGTQTVWGPIAGFEQRDYQCPGKNDGYFIRAHGGGGLSAPTPGVVDSAVFGSIFGCSQIGSMTFSVVSIVTSDGSPDNCGDVTPNYPVYTPGGNIVNTNITYNDNSGNSITIPVGFAFGYASIDVNANIKIPVSVNLNPNFNFNAEFNFSTGDINFNIGGSPADRGPATGDPRPGNQPDDYDTPSVPARPPGSPPSPDPSPKPKPEQRQVLVGAIVTSQLTSLGRLTEVKQDGGNPNIYAPNLGYINFYYRFGSGAAGWGKDLPVKNVQHFIPVEFDGGAVAVRGTPRQNVIWTITPVYLTRDVGDQMPA